MRFPHAAALVLVGWYLMMPPLDPANTTHFESRAPLMRWRPLKTYSSKNDCEKERDEERASGGRGLNSPSQTKRLIAAGLLSVQCVATDDPRLKGE